MLILRCGAAVEAEVKNEILTCDRNTLRNLEAWISSMPSYRRGYPNRKYHERQLSPRECTSLRLLLDRQRGMSKAIGGGIARASTLGLGNSRLVIFNLIIVVFVHIHVSSGGFVML
jgi:hypothetical protein